MRADTPAVVLGAGANGLGVARSLARARVAVWLLDSDPRRPELRTRAARPLVVPALQGEALVEALERLALTQFSGMRPVLFLTQEETVRTVSHHRDRLASLYRFSLPPVVVVDALQHKFGFQRMAERFGSPIPPLVHIRGPSELPELDRLHYPVVVKPGERNEDYGRRFRKAYRVETVQEADALVRGMLAVMPDIVVQEWIDGPDSNIYFCMQYTQRQGHLSASFTGRKIRSWPPGVGGTASCIAAPEVHDALSRLTSRFFQDAGVIGMASMEYKRDARSGEFRMVEPTIGRTDYQEEIATLNGVNLPYAAWCSELGLPFAAPPAKLRPVVWRVRTEDAQSAALQGGGSARGYPRDARVADALWRWNDPLPSVMQHLQHAASALRRRTTRRMARPLEDGSKP